MNNLIKYTISGLIFCCTSVANAATAVETTKDLALENKAKLAMILKRGVPSANIKTHADKGVLQLAGYVNNQEELRQVENALKEYLKQDHDKIINNVKICNEYGNADDEEKLVKHVQEHLAHFNFPVKDITVQARNNHIMLSGFVDEKVDLDEISAAVKNVPGVGEVDNVLVRKHR